jgi:hypothetical protein
LKATKELVNNLRINAEGMHFNATSEGSTTMLNKYIQAGMTRNEAYQAAKHGNRDRCQPAGNEHTWDSLTMLKLALEEAKMMNGVSSL